MSDSQKPVENTDEAPTTAPPAIPGSEETVQKTAVSDKDDIPAADADVKEGVVEKKTVTKTETQKAPEPPKDPRTDPLGWVTSLLPGAVHKVNHQVLDWAQKLAIEEEDKRQPLPGKNGAVTKNQFLGFLRDGVLLAKVANKLEPGAVEKVHEGEESKTKENQTSNINGFLKFVSDKVGLTEQQMFKPEDLLDKGKQGYNAVFNTLMSLGMKTQEKFNIKGIDSEQLVQAASLATQNTFIQTILNFFRRARPNPSPKQLAKEAEGKKTVKTAPAEVVEEKGGEEEVCTKVEKPAVPTPAVTAN